MSLPTREEVLVRGAWVLTSATVGEVRDGAVLIADGTIAAVGSYADLRRAHPAITVVGDGTGVVIPGLVNAHTHLSEALIPGMGSDLTLFEWGTRVVTPAGTVLTREMAREGSLLKAAELLHSGVTCVNDMFHHYHAGSFASLGVVEGLTEVGLRGMVAFGAEDAFEVFGGRRFTVEEAMEEHLALEEATAGAELLEFRMGVGTMLGSTDMLLEAAIGTASERSWPVHTHLAEVREEVVEARSRWGRNSVEQAAAIGLLDLEVIAAHLIWLSEGDVELLVAHRTAGAHNPIANMILGSGVSCVPRLRAAGLRLGLGTDGAASNDSQNMLEVMKMAALLQKVHRLDPASLTASEVLRMATIGGAEALGVADRIGSLEPGKRADVVLLGGTAELANIHDPYQQIAYCISPRSVSDVWVDGRRLLAAGVPTTVDEAEQIARCRPLAETLVRESGLVAEGMSRLCEM
ncbi:MAG: amidohydrolase family protein [Gammaproteobacteria bacterium]|nr:amidohydrolase family protein [Gammaproteobacteria bacterium]